MIQLVSNTGCRRPRRGGRSAAPARRGPRPGSGLRPREDELPLRRLLGPDDRGPEPEDLDHRRDRVRVVAELVEPDRPRGGHAPALARVFGFLKSGGGWLARTFPRPSLFPASWPAS